MGERLPGYTNNKRRSAKVFGAMLGIGLSAGALTACSSGASQQPTFPDGRPQASTEAHSPEASREQQELSAKFQEQGRTAALAVLDILDQQGSRVTVVKLPGQITELSNRKYKEGPDGTHGTDDDRGGLHVSASVIPQYDNKTLVFFQATGVGSKGITDTLDVTTSFKGDALGAYGGKLLTTGQLRELFALRKLTVEDFCGLANSHKENGSSFGSMGEFDGDGNLKSHETKTGVEHGPHALINTDIGTGFNKTYTSDLAKEIDTLLRTTIKNLKKL